MIITHSSFCGCVFFPLKSLDMHQNGIGRKRAYMDPKPLGKQHYGVGGGRLARREWETRKRAERPCPHPGKGPSIG